MAGHIIADRCGALQVAIATLGTTLPKERTSGTIGDCAKTSSSTDICKAVASISSAENPSPRGLLNE